MPRKPIPTPPAGSVLFDAGRKKRIASAALAASRPKFPGGRAIAATNPPKPIPGGSVRPRFPKVPPKGRGMIR